MRLFIMTDFSWFFNACGACFAILGKKATAPDAHPKSIRCGCISTRIRMKKRITSTVIM